MFDSILLPFSILLLKYSGTWAFLNHCYQCMASKYSTYLTYWNMHRPALPVSGLAKVTCATPCMTCRVTCPCHVVYDPHRHGHKRSKGSCISSPPSGILMEIQSAPLQIMRPSPIQYHLRGTIIVCRVVGWQIGVLSWSSAPSLATPFMCLW